jgi:O-antigen/teichoic acid export membrane protein
VPLAFGPKWSGLVFVLQWFSLAMPLKMLRDFLLNPLRARKFDKEVLQINTVFLLAQFVAAFLAFVLSFTNFVVATTILWLLASWYGLSLSSKKFNSKSGLYDGIWLPLCMVLAMLVVCSGVRIVMEEQPQIHRLVAMILAGVAIYGLASFTFRSRLIFTTKL